MRSHVALLALGLSSVASAGAPSNPAFLGVTMDPSTPTGGCPITGVTPDSAAAAAGIEFGDWIMAIDGVMTPNCNVVSAQIIAHQLGDTIKIELRRVDKRVTVRATLSTRAEILHRRLVGRALDSTEVVDLDDLQTYDLDDLRSGTTIVGLFNLSKCAGCAQLFRRVSDATREGKRDRSAAPRMLALTTGNIRALDSYRTMLNFGVPVYLANEEYLDRAGMVREDNRVYFLVVDSRGIIRFIAPMTPDAEDLDSAIDEVLAAADQSEHARATRR